MNGSSAQGIRTVLHPVSDLATARPVYTALLGVPPQTDEPYCVGFEAAGRHIGPATTSAAAAWSPRSRTPTATCSG